MPHARQPNTWGQFTLVRSAFETWDKQQQQQDNNNNNANHRNNNTTTNNNNSDDDDDATPTRTAKTQQNMLRPQGGGGGRDIEMTLLMWTWFRAGTPRSDVDKTYQAMWPVDPIWLVGGTTKGSASSLTRNREVTDAGPN